MYDVEVSALWPLRNKIIDVKDIHPSIVYTSNVECIHLMYTMKYKCIHQNINVYIECIHQNINVYK